MNKIKTLFLVGAMALTLTSYFTLTHTVGSGGSGAEVKAKQWLYFGV